MDRPPRGLRRLRWALQGQAGRGQVEEGRPGGGQVGVGEALEETEEDQGTLLENREVCKSTKGKNKASVSAS